MSDSRTVHILFENEAWLPPLLEGLEAEGLSHQLHHVHHGSLEATEVPEPGIYLNRMSPSSHTRGHLESVDLMSETLAWLEGHGRRVINGSRAFALEVSKFRQDMVLQRYGIRTPRTVMTVGTDQLLAAARTFEGRFITKHNQGGKGLGIQLFDSVEQLEDHVNEPGYDAGPKGQMLIQQYIEPAESFITRVELVGDRFLFAMQSATSGGFELCPADACQIPPAAPDVCPADGGAKFQVSPLTADDSLVQSYLRLMKHEGLDLAGIEFVEDAEGNRYTYDINGTTNYNSALGREVGVDGMLEVARLITRELKSSGSTGAMRRAAI
ncbi:MAG: alpha-L-glutamate ligase [Deltaproteobacteria bacterium]|nr:alpha-L-glutamate ligase [Deltaproteobacteria bacterium]